MGHLSPSPYGGGRILDFDIENRPLSYWTPDTPTAEITAIASCWVDDPSSLRVFLLAPPCSHPGCYGDCQPPGVDTITAMLLAFRVRYNEADQVTGHYIRKHDLPIINGALYDNDLPLLGPKLTQDTKLDMFPKADVPATQEFLLETLGIERGKKHMTQRDWREANRLTPEGIAKTKARVGSDVLGHMRMREEMLRRGWLRAPRMWNPKG